MNHLGSVSKQEWFAHIEAEQKGISCVHINAQSVSSKIEELESFFVGIDKLCDVVMISETWYTNDSHILELPHMKTFYLNRLTRRGGGVSLLMSDLIPCDILPNFSRTTSDYEVLCVHSEKDLFAVCYRPPDGVLAHFLDFLMICYHLLMKTA